MNEWNFRYLSFSSLSFRAVRVLILVLTLVVVVVVVVAFLLKPRSSSSGATF